MKTSFIFFLILSLLTIAPFSLMGAEKVWAWGFGHRGGSFGFRSFNHHRSFNFRGFRAHRGFRSFGRGKSGWHGHFSTFDDCDDFGRSGFHLGRDFRKGFRGHFFHDSRDHHH